MTTRKLVLEAILRQSLAAFIEKAFQVVSPSDLFLPNWHINVIADHLEQCYYGNIKRLIITMPPRSMKSICASVAFPCWVLGQDPSRRIICASYAADLALKFSRDCKAVMGSNWYREGFPGTRLERSAEHDLITTMKGGRYATSVGGTLTGRGGNIIIIDDSMKPQEGLSEASRNATKQWYDGTLYSRLDSKADDVIILVMQRLHVDDLVAHVTGKEEWVHLNLPAIATHDQSFILSDGRQFSRHTGDVLHPERESLRVHENIRSNIGSFNFEAQYQQQPVPVEGNLIKWSWFSTYETLPTREDTDQVIQSWDTATKVHELSDYSVCTTWLIKGNDYYLIDVYREKLDYPALKPVVVSNAEKFRPDSILIEDTASGSALLQDYHNHQLRGIPRPIPITPKGDKVVRMSAQSAKIEAGQVHLPRKAPWLDEFKKEFLAFPNGNHDDQVDSLSQFLNWFNNRHVSGVVKLTGL
ncbi:MAG: phage terminase large subunit [Pseudomonadota bacterium]